MSMSNSTTPGGAGHFRSVPLFQSTFDPAKISLFDVEVYPNHWCCGFLAPDGKYVVIDGDRSDPRRSG